MSLNGSSTQSPRRQRRRFQVGTRYVSDPRLICTCQLHRRPDNVLRDVLRKRYGTVLLSMTVAFGGLGAPMKAMSVRMMSIVPSIEETASRPSAKSPATRPLDPPLRLFSEKTRSEFAATGLMIDHFTIDTAKEEFFRTQIPYGTLIYREAVRNNLSPEFVAAVVRSESNFRPRLRSTKNAQGLMQIIPSTGELMGAGDLFNPAENVRAGTRYLRYLTERFRGDTTLIVAAYNAGESTVRRYGGVPPYPETVEYLQRVSRSTRYYERRFAEHVFANYAAANKTAKFAGH